MSTTDTPLEFVGTSREDLSEFPTKVKYPSVLHFARLRKAASILMPNH
jgi:hypothetical protein